MDGSFSSSLPSGPSPQRFQCRWPRLSELGGWAWLGKVPFSPPGQDSLEKPFILVLWWRVCMRAFHCFCLPSRAQARQRLDTYPPLLALRVKGVSNQPLLGPG